MGEGPTGKPSYRIAVVCSGGGTVPRPQPAKALIVRRGENMSEVAAAIDVGAQGFRNVLAGRAAPWPNLTARLSEYLNVEPAELWHDDKPLADAARTLVETTRHAQGLPPQITDVAVLDQVAAIVRRAGSA